MDLLKHKTDQEILESILAEIAKSTNEIRCASGDIQKANGRMTFAIAAINELIKRQKD
jgi:hypothetical protein